MARRGENIYKRKDGRYEGRYVIGKNQAGKTRFGYVYGQYYHDVRRKLLQKKANRLPKTSETSGYQGTLADWIQRWMSQELRAQVKVSTYQIYQSRIKRHILPALGHIALTKLCAADIRGFIDTLTASGMAAATISGIYRLLASSLRHAQDEGHIIKNLCAKIRIAHADRDDQRVLSRKEQQMMCKAANLPQDMPALLSLYTGMRLGEICALTWSDIDWTQKTVTVRRTVQRVCTVGAERKTVLMIGMPKTRQSRRCIPVPDFIIDFLAKCR